MTAAPLFGGLPRPLMAQCVAKFMKRSTRVLGRRMVDHAARAGSPKWGPSPQVWAHDSVAKEGHSPPPPRGMGGSYMVH